MWPRIRALIGAFPTLRPPDAGRPAKRFNPGSRRQSGLGFESAADFVRRSQAAREL
jgi:hypothetical protein